MQGLVPIPPLHLQGIYGHVGQQPHGLPLPQLQPGPYRATPLLQLPGLRIQIGRQRRQIYVPEVREGLAAPALDAPLVNGQQRLAETSHDGEALSPIRRWAGIEAHLVLPALVADDQIHLRQLQRRGLPQLIHPLHRPMTQGHLGLGEQPVRQAAIAAARPVDRQARDIELAVGGPPHRELGGLDIDLLHAQRHEGMGRHGDHDLGQMQGFAAIAGIVKHHVAKLKTRDNPRALGRNGSDGYGYSQAACGQRLQLRTPFADSRHNPAMEHPPHGGHHQP